MIPSTRTSCFIIRSLFLIVFPMFRTPPSPWCALPTIFAHFAPALSLAPGVARAFSNSSHDPLQHLLDHEKSGVPKNAGTDTDEGFSLRPTLELLKRLGNPHESLRAIHIAGSKGKGSVAAFTSSILAKSGLKTGVYTSPHMQSIRERIQLVGQGAIAEEAYAKLVEGAEGAIREVSASYPLSHFEVLTALSFKHFVDSGCDVAVIETGLGGVRDATNVLPPRSVLAAAVTSIGMEHVEALGGSLRSIAEAKAGIFKPSRPAIIGRQAEAEALEVLQQRATAAAAGAAPVTYAPDGVQVEALGVEAAAGWPSALRERIRVSYKGAAGGGIGEPGPFETVTTLLGAHQRDNIATSVATIEAVRQAMPSWELSDRSLVKGIASAVLPGRFQVLRREGSTYPLVLDGAHTVSSAAALADSLGQYFPGHRIAFVVACAADKDHKGIMAELRRARPSVIIFSSTQIAGSPQRSAGPGQLVGAWQLAAADAQDAQDREKGKGSASRGGQGKPLRCRELMGASVFSSVERAYRELSGFAGEPGVVVVTGSLHAVAEAMKVPM